MMMASETAATWMSSKKKATIAEDFLDSSGASLLVCFLRNENAMCGDQLNAEPG
jgi:hypothetical protein